LAFGRHRGTHYSPPPLTPIEGQQNLLPLVHFLADF